MVKSTSFNSITRDRGLLAARKGRVRTGQVRAREREKSARFHYANQLKYLERSYTTPLCG
jgi:hypothetical protein